MYTIYIYIKHFDWNLQVLCAILSTLDDLYFNSGKGKEEEEEEEESLEFPDKGVSFRETGDSSNEIDSPFTSICFRRTSESAASSFPSQLQSRRSRD